MKYQKEQWIAAYKKAVSDLNTDKPTSGLPCAIAGLRTIRGWLLEDVGPKPTVESIRKSFSELIEELSTAKGVDDGFLSNASAAAKAAGFKGTEGAISKLVD